MIFQSGSQLTLEKVLECKYLKDCEKRCGYASGLMFFNQMGLTIKNLGETRSRRDYNRYVISYDSVLPSISNVIWHTV